MTRLWIAMAAVIIDTGVNVAGVTVLPNEPWAVALVIGAGLTALALMARATILDG